MTTLLLAAIGVSTGTHLYTAWVLDGDGDDLATLHSTLAVCGIALIVSAWMASGVVK